MLKQLLPVPRVSVLGRILNQLWLRGFSDIWIVTNTPELMPPNVNIFSPDEEPRNAAVGLSSTELWSFTTTTVLLLGDVYYTDAAVDTILGHPAYSWTFFCRFGYNPDGTLGGGEGWAVKFRANHIARYRRVLETLQRRGDLQTKHFWQHYRMMCNQNPREHRELWGHVIIDDLTEDFDSPEAYHRWLEKYWSQS